MDDFKTKTRDAIVDYLKGKEEPVLVSDIIEHVGNEKLRVYPILMELYLEERLEVTEETELGGFVRVRLK